MFLNLRSFAPELVILGMLVALFFLDGFIPKIRKSEVPLILILLSCAAATLVTYKLSITDAPRMAFSGLIAADTFGNFFRYVFFFSAGVSAYLAFGSKELKESSRIEFSLLLLCVTLGMSLMALSTNLLSLYIGIETVSIISFVMAGFDKDDIKSNEASFKYLVFGALASGIMIYGFSLIYGFTGSLNYGAIGKFLAEKGSSVPAVVPVALLMTYAGLAYKISSFPMHFWTPDVYEGAPTPITTFFSVGPKAAGFAAFIRLIKDAFTVPMADGSWQGIPGSKLVTFLAVISALTMIFGNLSAIGQTNVKRMMAYSSIAHVGYMLMGVVTLNQFGLTAVLFYIIAYCAMNLGAFWVVCVVSDQKGDTSLDAFKGMGHTSPVLGVCMAIFLFSLTGIPLFSGFVGKFLLFAAVLKTPGFLWLAIIGVLNSVVSLYYYTKILKAMWLDAPPAGSNATTLSLYHGLGLVLLAIPTVVLGLFWGPVLQFAERSLLTLF